MIHELLPGLLAVEVPDDAHSFTIDEHLFFRAYYMGLEKIGRMRKLPPGTWSILGIGTADKISEQEWAGVVEEGFEDSDTFDSGTQYSRTERWISYWDYETESYEFDTRTASGLSLLKSHNLNPSTTVILTKNI